MANRNIKNETNMTKIAKFNTKIPSLALNNYNY